MSQNFILYFHINSQKIFLYCFLTFLVAQIFFWQKTNSIRPNFDIIPDLPSKRALKITSLGDNQFLFRVLTARIQNAGDVFAGFASLKTYDYQKIYDWLTLLDGLDHHSNLPPSLAAYVYSNTENKDNLRLIVKYLQEHAQRDIDKNWWWAFQAIFFAQNILGDDDKALELADLLSKTNDEKAPLWTRQISAFIYAKNGNDCAAFKVIKNIIDEANSDTKIKPSDMEFMRYFINQRLKKLKDKNFNPKNCS